MRRFTSRQWSLWSCNTVCPSANPNATSLHIRLALLHGHNFTSIAVDPLDPKFQLQHTTRTPVPGQSKPIEGELNQNGVKEQSSREVKKRQTFGQLLFEADVTAPVRARARLVDKNNASVDFAWWIKLLRFRVRVDGHQGAWDIFQGLRFRGIDLPTEGQHADELWDTIIRASLTLRTLPLLWTYVQELHARTSQRYDKLYGLVVAHFLSERRKAIQWHRSFKSLGWPQPGALRSVILIASMTSKASSTLKLLYSDHKESALYDILITRLCARRQYRDAVTWHFLLVENNDFPSRVEVVEPLFRVLSLTGRIGTLKSIRETFRLSSLELPHTALELSPERPFAPKTVSSTAVDSTPNTVHAPASTRRKTISDEFCARAFATRAFNPSFVIRSLATFGVRSIGPLSLRELGVRCRNLIQSYHAGGADPTAVLTREITAQLDALANYQIELKPCRYTTIFSELARGGHGKLLDAVLLSDQHPDVYEDESLQLRLLDSYIALRYWDDVHRTLAVLTIGHQNLAWNAWNTLLLAHINGHLSTQYNKADQILTMMRKLQVPLNFHTMRQACAHLLPTRRAGKVQVAHSESRPRQAFTSRLLLDAASSGLHVPAGVWSELLRRYGQARMYAELERISLWLAYHYTSKHRISHTLSDSWRSSDQINLVFPRLMQRAIVEWYFKSLEHPHFALKGNSEQPIILEELDNPSVLDHSLSTPTHLRGLSLLLLLRRYGLSVDTDSIRTAVRNRLVILTGSSTRRQNRLAAANNPYSLSRIIADVEKIWSAVGPLFDVPPIALEPDLPPRAKLYAHNLLVRLVLGRVVTKTVKQRWGKPVIIRQYKGVVFKLSSDGTKKVIENETAIIERLKAEGR